MSGISCRLAFVVRRGAAIAVLAWLVGACAQQPGPGVSAARPAPTQAQFDTAFLRLWGGPYADERLQAYVATVGLRLAAQTGLGNVRWRFSVVDSTFPTGGTSPDGNVFIARGMLYLVSDEAELAAVIAHEIGHVALRHHANRIERQRQELAPVVQAVDQGQVGEARRLFVEGVLRIQAYSRENEFEADSFAVQLLTKAGYPPIAVSKMLSRLRDHTIYSDRRAGRTGQTDERENLLASHPAVRERIERAGNEARPIPNGDRNIGVEVFLAAIDGMIVGRDLRNGVVRSGRLLHGVYGVRLTLPEGYVGLPDRRLSAVLARDGSGYIFSCEPEAVSGDMRSWMQQRVQGRRDSAVEAFAVQGFDAAATSIPIRFRKGPGMVRLIAIHKDESVCRFLMFLPPDTPQQRTGALDDSIRSFSRMSDSEQASVRPFRLRIQRASGGETLEALARNRSLPDGSLEFLRLLNGVEDGHRFTAGQPIKTLVRN